MNCAKLHFIESAVVQQMHTMFLFHPCRLADVTQQYALQSHVMQRQKSVVV